MRGAAIQGQEGTGTSVLSFRFSVFSIQGLGTENVEPKTPHLDCFAVLAMTQELSRGEAVL
jgi:hypothetical protein